MSDLLSGHRRLWAAVATVLLLAGFGVLGKAVADQRSIPEPPLTATAPTSTAPAPDSPSPSGSRSEAPSATPSPTEAESGLSRSAATRVAIPAIDVDSRLNRTGLASDGTIEVPKPGPQFDIPAWFTGSPAPGQLGPSVLIGHVDGIDTGPAVFFKIGSLEEGQDVKVTRQDGKVVTFSVYRVQRYPKNHFPTLAVYGNTDDSELRLITCGGELNPYTQHYEDNIVVFAKMKSVSKA
ncbi:class F sortase [Phycicoccus flavus]|uniref:class F sortase n=1 Tax=Phycicoccus flavus TaxID=2502783 RepID=UPI000FEBF077|nr:class F sortase [Phycicoccus flavus]NHA69321.1 class F sortase [Phycicoccus flavus]